MSLFIYVKCFFFYVVLIHDKSWIFRLAVSKLSFLAVSLVTDDCTSTSRCMDHPFTEKHKGKRNFCQSHFINFFLAQVCHTLYPLLLLFFYSILFSTSSSFSFPLFLCIAFSFSFFNFCPCIVLSFLSHLLYLWTSNLPTKVKTVHADIALYSCTVGTNTHRDTHTSRSHWIASALKQCDSVCFDSSNCSVWFKLVIKKTSVITWCYGLYLINVLWHQAL